MVLPKITFVLLCTQFLSPLGEGEDLQYKHYGKTRVSAEPAGALQTLFFAWTARLEAKRSHDQVTCPL